MTTPPNRALPDQTPERIFAVRVLSDVAYQLEREADTRRSGSHDAVVRFELLRATAALRFVAALIIRGGLDPDAWTFWAVVARDYLELVRSADPEGIIA